MINHIAPIALACQGLLPTKLQSKVLNLLPNPERAEYPDDHYMYHAIGSLFFWFIQKIRCEQQYWIVVNVS